MTIYLSDYSTFNSTQELNYHVKQHEVHNHEHLTASDRQVLRFISRYSVKYAGASHLKAVTIAEGVDKSDRTVRRIVSKLEALDIIDRVRFIRPKSGGTGANIIVIKPFVTSRMTEREVDDKARSNAENKASNDNEPLHKRDKPSNTNETLVLKHSLPRELYQAFSPFFNAKDLYKTIGTLYKAKGSIDSTLKAEENPEYVDAFLSCIRRYKEGKVRNLQSYLYAAWKKVSRGLYLREMARLYSQ